MGMQPILPSKYMSKDQKCCPSMLRWRWRSRSMWTDLRVQISEKVSAGLTFAFASYERTLSSCRKYAQFGGNRNGNPVFASLFPIYGSLCVHPHEKLAMAKNCAISVWSVSATVAMVICRYCKLRILILEQRENFEASMVLVSIPCIIVLCCASKHHTCLQRHRFIRVSVWARFY